MGLGFTIGGILMSALSGLGLYWLISTAWEAANAGNWGILALSGLLTILFGGTLLGVFIGGIYIAISLGILDD